MGKLSKNKDRDRNDRSDRKVYAENRRRGTEVPVYKLYEPSPTTSILIHCLTRNSSIMRLVLLTYALLTQPFALVAARNRYEFQTPIEKQDEYDFVIVGGGTSGLVVADRLTEDPDSKRILSHTGEYTSFLTNLDFSHCPGH